MVNDLMWVYLKVENDLENVNVNAFWYLIQIYWILIMSMAGQNSRIDADHTANTTLYNDRPTMQNFINVCSFIFIVSAPLIANYRSQTVSPQNGGRGHAKSRGTSSVEYQYCFYLSCRCISLVTTEAKQKCLIILSLRSHRCFHG